jgi:hypothetical protein
MFQHVIHTIFRENLILLAPKHLLSTMFLYFYYVGFCFLFWSYIIQLSLPAYLVEPYYCLGFEQFMFDMLIVVN